MTTQTIGARRAQAPTKASPTPGNYIVWGALALFLAGIALAGAFVATPLLAVLALPLLAVGGTLLAIGVIAWGVRIGMRAAWHDVGRPA